MFKLALENQVTSPTLPSILGSLGFDGTLALYIAMGITAIFAVVVTMLLKRTQCAVKVPINFQKLVLIPERPGAHTGKAQTRPRL